MATIELNLVIVVEWVTWGTAGTIRNVGASMTYGPVIATRALDHFKTMRVEAIWSPVELDHGNIILNGEPYHDTNSAFWDILIVILPNDFVAWLNTILRPSIQQRFEGKPETRVIEPNSGRVIGAKRMENTDRTSWHIVVCAAPAYSLSNTKPPPTDDRQTRCWN